ncbi:acetyltransf_18 domain-containing protein [Trichonephila clavipes]|nr:acetyltransf_18 domain-containing protein [Trichonephila clavipes]
MEKIAPLYADDSSVAEAMVKQLITAMPETKGFAIVTINTNIFANIIPEKFGIPVHNSYYRLYTKEKLPIDTKEYLRI